MKRLLLLSALLFTLGCNKSNETSTPQTSSDTDQKKEVKAAEATKPAIENLLFSGATWWPTCDEYGSTIDTADAMLKDSILKVTFTLTPKKEADKWPYIELVAKPEKALSEAKVFSLEYTCDKPLLIKIAQKDFGPEGDESYAYYQKKLPAAAEFTKAEIKIEELLQPEWAPEAAKKIALDLGNCTAIYIVPELSAETGEMGTVALKHLSF